MNTNSKLRVALFFGGVSSEHDVSCVSASAWLRALGQEPCADKYEVFPVGITKDGRWLACRPTPEAMADGSWEQGDCTPCVLSPDRKDHGIWLLKDGRAELVHIDICAPVMHGKNGEDGTIQGLFERRASQPRDRFQFVRNGYFTPDSKHEGVYNRIVTLKDSFKL